MFSTAFSCEHPKFSNSQKNDIVTFMIFFSDPKIFPMGKSLLNNLNFKNMLIKWELCYLSELLWETGFSGTRSLLSPEKLSRLTPPC